MKHLFLAGAAALVSGVVHAGIIEFNMTSTVEYAANPASAATPYFLAIGDSVALTMRYDSTAPGVIESPFSKTYANAITYFGLTISRGGTDLYSGAVTGNFGQVRVENRTAAGYYDRIDFNVFSDPATYHYMAPPGTNAMPWLPAHNGQGDTGYGAMIFHFFRIAFTTTDQTVLASTDLPADAGWSSLLSPQPWVAPWGVYWQFERPQSYWPNQIVFGTFGRSHGGSETTMGVREYVPALPGGGGSAPVPEHGPGAVAAGLAIACLAAVRRLAARA
jgi:hypothetical protein